MLISLQEVIRYNNKKKCWQTKNSDIEYTHNFDKGELMGIDLKKMKAKLAAAQNNGKGGKFTRRLRFIVFFYHSVVIHFFQQFENFYFVTFLIFRQADRWTKQQHE